MNARMKHSAIRNRYDFFKIKINSFFFSSQAALLHNKADAKEQSPNSENVCSRVFRLRFKEMTDIWVVSFTLEEHAEGVYTASRPKRTLGIR